MRVPESRSVMREIIIAPHGRRDYAPYSGRVKQGGPAPLELKGRASRDLVVYEIERREVGVPAGPKVFETEPQPGLDGVLKLGAGGEERIVSKVGLPVHRLLCRIVVDPTSDAGANSELRENLVLP